MENKTSKKENPKIRYKTKPIRMDDRTWEQLKENKITSGLSWNLFLLKLLEKKN